MVKKRKTREQKIRALLRRQAALDGQAQFTTPTFEFVKREFDASKLSSDSQAQNLKRTKTLGRNEIIASSPRDLLKTLVISMLILATEVVLYFAWYVHVN